MPNRLARSVAAAALVAGGLIAGQIILPAGAGLPANKAAASASTVEIMHTQIGPGSTDKPAEDLLLSGLMKMPGPSDLLINVSAECALWTNTTTQGNDDQESIARVEIWVTLDGKTVPVSATDTASGAPTNDPDKQASAGRVVFCNRAQRMKTEFFDEEQNNEEDEIIRLYNRTRSANAFTFVALNVGKAFDSPANGNNIIEYKVFARLAAQVICDSDTATNGCLVPNATPPQNPAAKAAVGKRTVVLEPTRFAHNAQI